MKRSIRRRAGFIGVPIALVLLIGALLIATQQPGGASSTVLTVFDGTAAVAHGAGDFARAADGAILTSHDRVRTDDAGHALITFFDGSTLEIEPSTTVEIDTAMPNANGSISIELGQTIGRTWASVHHLVRTDSKFEIRTPTSTATVRGTGFLTEVLASGETTVQTTDGIVAVTGQGTTVLVTQGLQTTVRPNSAPTTPASMPSPSNTLRFGMHSPAYLVIVDALGRSCGITAGAAVVRHIPGCVASAPGSEPQLVELPNAAPGTYRAIIVAIEPGGPFTLTATALDGRGTVSFDLSLGGSGVPGAVFGSALEVRAGPDGRLDASALAALVTLQSPPTSPTPPPSIAAAANETTQVVPAVASPTAPLTTATPAATVAPSAPATAEPRTQRPALRTPAPEPIPTVTPSPAATASPTPVPTATPTATTTVTPSPAPTIAASPQPTPSPSPTPAPSPTPVKDPNQHGCVPSTFQPTKCEP